MEIGAIIAVGSFTLAGTIIGGIVSYVLQKKVAEKQREWALIDESRKLKREIMGERLQGIEEQMGLMTKVVYDAIDELTGEPTMGPARVDRTEANRRIAEMHSDVWMAVLLTGSEKLKENYRMISRIYWGFWETGDIGQYEKEWGKIRSARLAVMTIVDNMRTLGEEAGG